MDGLDGWIGLDWILLRSLVLLEHLAVLITLIILRIKNHFNVKSAVRVSIKQEI